ncbi:hypothetical protein [Poseidonocella sp. HB161398]|uniref:hypothetical protein n=1 Tax=Poseidonocella sp. HB161398 TaxID=2320855 RepID=UPI0011087B82|nr:hypothetical protein [Poseidonocella sp. HB161398]
MTLRIFAASAALCAAAAAASAGTAPAAWLGETPHFVMVGRAGGHDFDIRYDDIAAAQGVAGLEAKREYLQDDDGFLYGDFEFTLQAVIDGIEKQIELEFENRDFAGFALPASFELQEGEFPEGPYSNAEVEFEWEADGVSVNGEVAGWTGRLDMAMDSGTPDAQGLKGDGLVAGYLAAEKDGETLAVSFTVPVTEFEIED